MRETWVNWFQTNLNTSKMMRIFFVIGVPETFTNNSQKEAYQQQLSDELNSNGDVADGYMNLTYKMLALFDFVLTASECAPERAPQLCYVFKGSDDIYVSPWAKLAF